MARNPKLSKKNKIPKLSKKERKALLDEAQALDAMQSDTTSTPAQPVKKVPEKIVEAPRESRKEPGLLGHASVTLSLAAGFGFLMLLAALFLPDGISAVRATGGFPEGAVSQQSAQIVLTLDTLFPTFLFAGLALLVTGFQSRGNRPLVRLILTALLVVMISDLAENALVFIAVTGGEANAFQPTLTAVKYAVLAFAGIMLTALLPIKDSLGQFVHVLLRYAYPLGAAFLLSGLGGPVVRDVIAVLLPIAVLVLAIYSQQRADSG